jgi:hypothetical protein
METIKDRAVGAEKQVELITAKYANVHHLDLSSQVNHLKREYEQLLLTHKDVKAERDLLKIESQVLQNLSAENRKFHSPYPQYAQNTLMTQNTHMTQNTQMEPKSLSSVFHNSNLYQNKENAPHPHNPANVVNNTTFGKTELEHVKPQFLTRFRKHQTTTI